jgi:hypothetical protein
MKQTKFHGRAIENAIEYPGLSMSKDQVVNTSIDGEAVRRALIPGHLLNANHWFERKEILRARLETDIAECQAEIAERQAKVAERRTEVDTLLP